MKNLFGDDEPQGKPVAVVKAVPVEYVPYVEPEWSPSHGMDELDKICDDVLSFVKNPSRGTVKERKEVVNKLLERLGSMTRRAEKSAKGFK